MSESEATEMPAAVEDLPPSCKLVYYVLDRKGTTMTQKDLHNETTLTYQTITYALGRLEEADLVDRSFKKNDARKRVYETAGSE